MPLYKFKAMCILVDAPNPHDPGLVVRGFQQCDVVVKALLAAWLFGPDTSPQDEGDFIIPRIRRSKHLPPITIEVRDTSAAKWHANWACNKSIPQFCLNYDLNDFEAVLTALKRIRFAESMTVNFPRGCPPVAEFWIFHLRRACRLLLGNNVTVVVHKIQFVSSIAAVLIISPIHGIWSREPK